MGQRLNDAQRTELLTSKAVQSASQEHVILRNGTIVDPADFPFSSVKVIQICKLLNCCCGKSHQVGMHVLMHGVKIRNIFGTVLDIQLAKKLPCPEGRWVVEEELSEDHATAGHHPQALFSLVRDEMSNSCALAVRA